MDRFPPRGFLVLGVLSLASSVIYVVRSFAVDATGERIVSAIIFGAMGALSLAAYRFRGGPT